MEVDAVLMLLATMAAALPVVLLVARHWRRKMAPAPLSTLMNVLMDDDLALAFFPATLIMRNGQ